MKTKKKKQMKTHLSENGLAKSTVQHHVGELVAHGHRLPPFVLSSAQDDTPLLRQVLRNHFPETVILEKQARFRVLQLVQAEGEKKKKKKSEKGGRRQGRPGGGGVTMHSASYCRSRTYISWLQLPTVFGFRPGALLLPYWLSAVPPPPPLECVSVCVHM